MKAMNRRPGNECRPMLCDAAAQFADSVIAVAGRVGSAAAVTWVAIYRMAGPTGIARITCQQLASSLCRFGATRSLTAESARKMIEALISAGFVFCVDKCEGHSGGFNLRPSSPADIMRMLAGEPKVVDGDGQTEVTPEPNSNSNTGSAWSFGGGRGGSSFTLPSKRSAYKIFSFPTLRR